MKSPHPVRRLALVGALVLTGLSVAESVSPEPARATSGGGISAYISPPFVQGPKESINASIETFETLALGTTNTTFTSSVGTFSAGLSVWNGEDNSGEFGGANTTTSAATAGGTASKFVSPSGTVTLTFPAGAPVKYLGFWWSAGGGGDELKLYSSATDTTPAATFTTPTLHTLLGPGAPDPYPGTPTLSALNGTSYLKGHYFGRPRDHSQVAPSAWHNRFSLASVNDNIYSHAYVNVFASGSVGFEKVEFSGNGFEFDNVAISTVAQTPSPELVFIQSVGGKSAEFRANGGVGVMPAQISDTGVQATLSANTFTRLGYTFTGWHTTSTGTGGTSYADQALYDFSTDATLYAQWNPNTLAITYDTQGGSAITAGSTTTGGSISANPGPPTRAGHTFDGWFTAPTGGSSLTFPYTHGQTANFTLYAQWTAVQGSASPPVAFVPPPPPLPTPIRVGDARGESSSLAVSQTYFSPGVDVVYLATEDTYADALVAGPRAGSEGGPILLTDPDRMTKAVADEIIRLRPASIVIVGQTNAVGPDVEAAARFLAPIVTRVGGVDRYETAVQMSRRLTGTKSSTDTVYIASGEDFADAVTSGPIASLDGAPILLTRRNSLPAVTRAELADLDPREIVIIGGTEAVSANVATELTALADVVTRIGGDNRYATAARLAAENLDTGVDTVFLAVGEQFHHAVVSAPIATTKRTAVLLVQPRCVPLATRNQLDRIRPQNIVVVGADTADTRRILALTPC